MSDRLSLLETRLREIEAALASLSARIDALERHLSAGPVPLPAVPAYDSTAGLHLPESHGLLALVGRSLMVLGGAFLLRALTESGRLPTSTGVALGLCYAAVWLGAADRTVGASSVFHGLVALVIGVPIIWEAATRFNLLSPPATAAALAALTGIALLIAWHRRLPSLAGVATAGATAATLALMVATGRPLPFLAAIIVLGAGSLWLSDRPRWRWLAWPAALVADLALIGVITRATAVPALESHVAVLGAQGLLIVAYLGSIVVRTLLLGRPVRPFDLVQTAAAIGIGLGGAVLVARSGNIGSSAIGAVSLLAGAGAYLVALAIVIRRPDATRNFHFYGSLAVALVLVGAGVLFTRTTLAVSTAGLAVVVSWLGSRFAHPALTLHGAVYALAAAIASGFVAVAAATWLGHLTAWPSMPAAGWIALGAIVVSGAFARPEGIDTPAPVARGARLVLAILAAAGIGTACLLLAGPAISGDVPNAGVVASLRTVVLAIAAVVLARAAAFPGGIELGWLAYPALAFGGVKLIVEDFAYSRPATLFVALAVYGAALIAVPRIIRRRTTQPAARGASG